MLLSGEQTLRNGFFGIFEQNIRWPVARDKIVENLCIIISLLSIFKPKTIQKKNVLQMQKHETIELNPLVECTLLAHNSVKYTE